MAERPSIEEEEEEEEEDSEGEEERCTFGQWQLQRLHAERRSFRQGLITLEATAYLTQFFYAPRFASLSSEIRFEQLAAIASHMAIASYTMARQLPQGGERRSREPLFIKPPGGRGGEAGRPPVAWKFELNEDGAELCPVAICGPPVPSRRARGSTSPSVLLTPGLRKSTGATHPSILQLNLYEEAKLHLDTLLAQLPLRAQRSRRVARAFLPPTRFFERLRIARPTAWCTVVCADL